MRPMTESKPKSEDKLPEILVIVGPTASGKSDLAVRLAKERGGEVVSADSRQVYKGLDIGTGKITPEEMRGVPHHLLDVADPRRPFNVTEYIKLADEAIAGILSRGKLPIVCGGTGFYIQALVDRIDFPQVEADPGLRAELSSKPPAELLAMLKRLDPERFARIDANQSDRNNARRIIRAIEIASAKVRPNKVGPWNEAEPFSDRDGDTASKAPSEIGPNKVRSLYAPTFIGINPPREELRAKIRDRLMRRLDAGMLDEARRLHESGLSFERMDDLGLEYRYMARFLQGQIAKEDMIKKLDIEIGKYAKRQMTWFGKDERIEWFESNEKAAPV